METTKAHLTLPDEIIHSILYGYGLILADAQVSKKFSCAKREYYSNHVRRIQRWFRYHQFSKLLNVCNNNCVSGLDTFMFQHHSFIVRYYMNQYPMKYMQQLPELIKRKCPWISLQAKEAVDKIICIPVCLRKRSHLRAVLMHLDSKTIIYTGW